MINIKCLDPNKIKTDEKSYKKIRINHISSATIKSAKLLSLIINKTNRYIGEGNENDCLILLFIDEKKETLKKYEELWDKISDIIRLISNSSDEFHKKYMQIKFNSGDHL